MISNTVNLLHTLLFKCFYLFVCCAFCFFVCLLACLFVGLFLFCCFVTSTHIAQSPSRSFVRRLSSESPWALPGGLSGSASSIAVLRVLHPHHGINGGSNIFYDINFLKIIIYIQYYTVKVPNLI